MQVEVLYAALHCDFSNVHSEILAPCSHFHGLHCRSPIPFSSAASCSLAISLALLSSVALAHSLPLFSNSSTSIKISLSLLNYISSSTTELINKMLKAYTMDGLVQ